MRQSQFFIRTGKEVAQEEVSVNAKLLTRGGYINRLMAGVYSLLPLGLRVVTKIENIIREEMVACGASEVLMPALHPKEIWDTTKRWEMDVLFRLKGAGDRDLALGPTHEEVVTPLIGSHLRSYRDFPAAVFQLQTKFRNEARAKSGILRGREFRMKDMYSFDRSSEALDAFYERAAAAYSRVFDRLGIGDRTYYTFATGGDFSKYSHEFQTVTEFGEDTIFTIPGTKIAINREIIDDASAVQPLLAEHGCSKSDLQEVRAIEVGNIFKLGTRFSDDFGLTYVDEQGAHQKIWMGCYGIGPTRVLGTLVECSHDERGIIWNRAVAPFLVHLIALGKNDSDYARADKVYEALQAAGIEVLYDDRREQSAGSKFADSDLIGIPHRIVVSERAEKAGGVEWKQRSATESKVLPLSDVLQAIRG